MNLSYIKIIVENETVSEVVYRNKGGEGKRESESERQSCPKFRNAYTQ